MFMIIKCRPRLVRGSAMCRQSEVHSQISRPTLFSFYLLVEWLMSTNKMVNNSVNLRSNALYSK